MKQSKRRQKKTQTSEEDKQRDTPLIVGIGASAGGLGAFKTFFRNMPTDSGIAFVLVQHLDPSHKSMLTDLLAGQTEMQVTEAQDGAEVVANQVLVISPNSTLTIEKGHLKVASPAPERIDRHPIDVFFDSLAADQGENAVCIILSGAGSDGSLGLRRIKEYGGLVLAQEGFSESMVSSMADSAVATGLVDCHLPIEQMPDKLIEYKRNMRRVHSYKDADGNRSDVSRYVGTIAELLRSGIGHDFRDYKQNTLVRRIQRRMQVTGIAAVPDYVKRLREDDRELDLLFHDLLIGVTQFFRDAEAFEVLERTIIPKLLKNHGPDEEIRIWVPGCGTGEEAYSFAILLREAMEQAKVSQSVQIFATDIDGSAVEVARHGRYRKLMPGLSDERLKRWFITQEGGYAVAKDIRDMCVFAEHSIIKDPPFSRLDLISCRNVLIYMNSDLQDRVIRKFHYGLKPGGYLFLGLSEGATRSDALFKPVDKKWRIFQRQPKAAAQTIPDFSLPSGTVTHHEPQPIKGRQYPEQDRLDISARRAMSKYTVPYVVVDRRREILRFSGGAVGQYLEPSAGAASFDLYGLVKKTLRSAVRDAVQEVFIKGTPVVRERLPIRINGEPRAVTVIIEPLPDGGGGRGIQFCVVAFRDAGFAGKPATEGEAESEPETVAILEHELRVTKAQLQSTINEMETTSEELKSSNEEYQSVNEELQSSNEELETAKEEMQSVNEELQTVNSELSSTNEELQKANNDLRNLLENTQIATIFLDQQLRIRNFTPGMKDLFHLRDSDRGRPITEIVTRLNYDNMRRDVDKVLRKLTPIEHEVAITVGEQGTWLMRVLPYRTVDNVIDGVVITFVDISERKREEMIRARLAALVNSSEDAIILHSLEGNVLNWNDAAEKLLGYSASEAIGKPMTMFLPAGVKDDLPRQIEALKRHEGAPSAIDVARVDREDKPLYLSIQVSPVLNAEGNLTALSTVARDVSDIRLKQQQTELLMHELSHRVKNTLATVQVIATQTLHATSTLEAFGRSFESRLMALARSHDLLSQSKWNGAMVHDILNQMLDPYQNETQPQWTLAGRKLTVNAKATLALSLAFHELATNAAKYGALSAESGHVDVKWQVQKNETLHVTWTERDGPQVEKPEKNGFGSRLIQQGLAHELEGSVALDYKPSGLKCTIDLPLENVLPDVRGGGE